MFTTACALVALAGGSVTTAQPVARHLVDDADAVETLLHQQSLPTANLWASLHLLDDLDVDGLRDVLVTHQRPLPVNPVTLGDNFKAFVRSSQSGNVLLELPPDDTKVFKTAHAAAVMIHDINADGVRDIASGRTFNGRGVGLRVHCGATGEVLFAPYEDDITFPYGVSMIPWDDMDGDGQPDLLLGSGPGNTGSPLPFALWSPLSGQFTPLRPVDYGQFRAIHGFTLLDLGVGATGAREVLTTFMPANSAIPTFGFAMLGGAPLRAMTINFDAPVAGAVRLGDFNDDEYREIVMARGWPVTQGPPFEFGTPVFSGELPSTNWPPVAPLLVQELFIVVELKSGLAEVRTGPGNAVVPLGDATGDGFPDYAFLASFNGEDEFNVNYCVVAACGRTGRAYFAAEQQNAGDASKPVFPTRSIDSLNSFRGRDALVCPGDINNDGAPDLLLLVLRDDYTVDPPLREQLLLTHYLPTPCAGDTDFDRVVNFNDLNAVLSNFGAQDITSPADLNASGVVDFTDLNLVLSAFGSNCD